MTETNIKLSTISNEYQIKADESLRQKEEITHLLAKVIIFYTEIRLHDGGFRNIYPTIYDVDVHDS